MNMNKLVILGVMLFSTASNAETVRTNGGHVGCIAADYFIELVEAVTSDNRKAFEALIESENCLPIAEGVEVEILEEWKVAAKIRLHSDEASLDLFVPRKMIR